jgi:methyl coenzyme M reductase subunit D
MESTKVQWSLGFTMNTGNFQSLRIDCQVQDSVRDGESTKEASDRIYGFVEEQLTTKLNEAKEELA